MSGLCKGGPLDGQTVRFDADDRDYFKYRVDGPPGRSPPGSGLLRADAIAFYIVAYRRVWLGGGAYEWHLVD